MKTNRFEITTATDLMTAKRMLNDHKAELSTQRTDKAISWQIGVIKELKQSIRTASNKGIF